MNDKNCRIHLNDEICVRLTPNGQRIITEFYDSICRKYPMLSCRIKPQKQDEDGNTHFLLWEFMSMFGEYMHMGEVQAVIDPLEICLVKRYVEREEVR